MIDERTKNICKGGAKYPNTPTFKEHQSFMMRCNLALWKQHINEMKNLRPKEDKKC